MHGLAHETNEIEAIESTSAVYCSRGAALVQLRRVNRLTTGECD